MTAITVSTSHDVFRGDRFSTAHGRVRVMAATATTLTTRRVHEWRWVERCHGWIEDHIVWPLQSRP